MTDIVPLHPEQDMDNLVGKYVQLRDKRDEVRRAHQEIEAKYKAGLDFLGNRILEFLNATHQEQAGTKHGTAYKSVQTSATVRDWPATLAFIREREAWDLLEARVSKLAAEAVIADTKAPIPGVDVKQFVTVSVRRASAARAS